MDYRAKYQAWLNAPELDEDTRRELLALTDEKEIEDRFYRELEFGTAGLRGVLGAGTNRMNRYVVRRATQGFAQYICSLGEEAKQRGVAIAHDSRILSPEFAMEAALVLCANGIKTYLYDSLHAVPQLSFAVLQLHCIAGIVITASHNPPQYNGYKVYGENGGQLPPEPSLKVTEYIEALDFFGIPSMSEQAARETGLLIPIGEELDAEYDACVRATSLNPDILHNATFRVVYTPLHGAGYQPVTRALKGLGFQNLFVVPEQAEPDGRFPTVRVPNPEDRNAYELAIALAKEKDALLILATDPDSDRLGAAVKTNDGDYQLLTGNQIGCLLLEYILGQRRQKGMLPAHGFAVKSIVSTQLAAAIAAHYGVEMDDVLTGFRFISDKIYESIQQGERQFLFGFEESYGFLVGTYARDKDGISAAVMLCEVAAFYAEQNKTLLDALEEIYQKYGYYLEEVVSYTLAGKEGIAAIQEAMVSLRQEPPKRWNDMEILAVRDYQSGLRTAQGRTIPMGLPKSNVLYYELEEDGFIAVRPSGTEPKLKAYIGVRANSHQEAEKCLNELVADVKARLNKKLGL